MKKNKYLIIGGDGFVGNYLFKNLKNNNFPINEIKSFHYFDIGRWDILFKNNKLLKLPSGQNIDVLKNFILLRKDTNFEKYNIFDYRLKKQLILNYLFQN